MISLIYYTQKSLSLIKLKLNVFIPTLKSVKSLSQIPMHTHAYCLKGFKKGLMNLRDHVCS